MLPARNKLRLTIKSHNPVFCQTSHLKRCRAPTRRVSTMHILWAQGIKNDFYLALSNASKTPLKSKVITYWYLNLRISEN